MIECFNDLIRYNKICKECLISLEMSFMMLVAPIHSELSQMAEMAKMAAAAAASISQQ